MSYYEFPNSKFPSVVEYHIDNILLYISSLIFYKDFVIDPQKAYNRILISDVNAGANVSIGDAIQFMKSMNGQFPFAVYNITDWKESEYGKSAPVTNYQLLYVPEIDSYVRAYPMEVETMWIVFYTDANDYRLALTMLGGENSTLGRLFTKINFFNVEVNLPTDLYFEFSKGSYYNEFEQYLQFGKIFDITFSLRFRYYEYILDGVQVDDIRKIIKIRGEYYPISKVDNFIFRLFNNESTDDPLAEVTIENRLEIQYTDPSNNLNNVPLDKEITIKFNKAINPENISEYVIINPSFDMNIYYNTNYDMLHIRVVDNGFLLPNTKYTVKLKKDIKDWLGVTLLDDYEFSFYTITN